MKVSVQFPLKTESENVLRSLPMVVANVAAKRGRGAAIGIAQGIANRVKKQRAEVRRYLDSQLPRLKREVLSGEEVPIDIERQREGRDRFRALKRPNRFRVTIVRISAGTLDTDGLHGALKHVRDEVAAWLGVDDGPRSPAIFQTAQQKGPQKVYAVRIEIEDDDPDPREVHRNVGPPIAKLGPVMRDGEPPSLFTSARRMVSTRRPLASHDEIIVQEQIIFRRSFYEPAERQDAASDERTLVELTGEAFAVETPAPRIRIKGRVYERRQDHDPALGEHWIYEAAPSAAPAGGEVT